MIIYKYITDMDDERLLECASSLYVWCFALWLGLRISRDFGASQYHIVYQSLCVVFNILLLVCLMLYSVHLTRWPWKRKFASSYRLAGVLLGVLYIIAVQLYPAFKFGIPPFVHIL